MKKLILISTALLIFMLMSCDKKETDTNEAIKELEVKLTATEAQLINVSAELAKCKGEDETKYIDSTQLDQVVEN